MFDYKEVLSLLFLFVALVFTIYNVFLFGRANENTYVVRSVFCFNLFALLHALFGIVTNLFFSSFTFLFLGDPLVLFYAPFFMLILKKENSADLKNRNPFLISNFGLGVLGTSCFVVLVLNKTLYEAHALLYTQLLYSIVGVQMIVYALVGMFLIQKYRVVGSKSMIWRLFFDVLLLLSVAGGFFLTGVYKIGTTLNGELEDNRYVVYLFVLFAVITAHRVFIRKSIVKGRVVKMENAPVPLQTEEIEVLDGKYSKSRIDEARLQSYAEKIKKLDATYFLHSSIKIDTLSEVLKIPTHHLAQTFSIVFKQNYSQYVNQQRIAYAVAVLEEQLELGKENEKNFSEIALRAGFNSDSSFYRAFKECHDMSPSEWMKLKKLETQAGK